MHAAHWGCRAISGESDTQEFRKGRLSGRFSVFGRRDVLVGFWGRVRSECWSEVCGYFIITGPEMDMTPHCVEMPPLIRTSVVVVGEQRRAANCSPLMFLSPMQARNSIHMWILGSRIQDTPVCLDTFW